MATQANAFLWLLVCAACSRPTATDNRPPSAEAGPTVVAAAASATLIPVAAVRDAAPEATAGEATTLLTLAGRFDVDYPTRLFHVTPLPRGALLRTTISERYRDHTYPFELELRLVSRAVTDEVRAASYDPPLFKTSDESTFQEQAGFAERLALPSGMHGYVVEMGVEGIGQIDTYIPVSPRETLHATCRYCCGLIDTPPAVTMEEQQSTCAQIVGSLRPH